MARGLLVVMACASWFVLTVVAVALLLLSGFRFPFFDTPRPPGLPELLLTYAAAPALLVLAALLPARALGAGWPTALLGSLAYSAVVSLAALAAA